MYDVLENVICSSHALPHCSKALCELHANTTDMDPHCSRVDTDGVPELTQSHLVSSQLTHSHSESMGLAWRYLHPFSLIASGWDSQGSFTFGQTHPHVILHLRTGSLSITETRWGSPCLAQTQSASCRFVQSGSDSLNLVQIHYRSRFTQACKDSLKFMRFHTKSLRFTHPASNEFRFTQTHLD